MIKTCLSLLISLFTFSSFCQVAGSWKGDLPVQGMTLPLIFHISKTGSGFTATMDSPSQGATGIAVTETTFIEGELKMQIKNLGASFTGTLSEDEIPGMFEQGGLKIPITLTPIEKPAEAAARPQDPQPPFPYKSEDVSFKNETDKVTLAGTLTVPDDCNQCPAVILISGSGPQDRNSEIFNHRPFLVLADQLSKSNIAVLRFDDRGVGKSTGNYGMADHEDFARDVEEAITFLKTKEKIDSLHIGLLGHSDGGAIATKVAAKREDVAFIVSLAGPAVPGAQIIKAQQINQIENVSLSDKQRKDLTKFIDEQMNIALKSSNRTEMKSELESFYKKNFKKLPPATRDMGLEKFSKIQIKGLTSPWLQSFIKYDPRIDFANINCPMLALFGEKDVQVNPDINLPSITASFEDAGKDNLTAETLTGLNHLFQPAETGAVMEYGMIETTFDQAALNKISSWIIKTLE